MYSSCILDISVDLLVVNLLKIDLHKKYRSIYTQQDPSTEDALNTRTRFHLLNSSCDRQGVNYTRRWG